MNTVTIHQPNYLPWPGYFAKMSIADTHVFLDDVQFSKGSYTNRVTITSQGNQFWLTVPVAKADGAATRPAIREMRPVEAERWRSKHVKAIHEALGKEAFFPEILPVIDAITTFEFQSLAEMNSHLIRIMAGILDIHPQFVDASTLAVDGIGTDRLASICTRLRADAYVMGTGGTSYMDESKMKPLTIRTAALDKETFVQAFPGVQPSDTTLAIIARHGTQRVRESLAAVFGLMDREESKP